MAKTPNKIEQLAESVWLRLGNRVANIVALGVLGFAATQLVQIHDDNIKFSERIIDLDKRVVSIEHWRENVSYLIRGTR